MNDEIQNIEVKTKLSRLKCIKFSGTSSNSDGHFEDMLPVHIPGVYINKVL